MKTIGEGRDIPALDSFVQHIDISMSVTGTVFAVVYLKIPESVFYNLRINADMLNTISGNWTMEREDSFGTGFGRMNTAIEKAIILKIDVRPEFVPLVFPQFKHKEPDTVDTDYEDLDRKTKRNGRRNNRLLK